MPNSPPPRHPITAWPGFKPEAGRTLPQPSPRPVSSVYSEYVPLYPDPQRPVRALQSPPSVPRCSATGPASSGSWRTPRVSDHDVLFSARAGGRYPPPGQGGPSASVQSSIPGLHPSPDTQPRGRGFTIRSNTAAPADLRRMYFDLQLQEWRPIPGRTQISNPEEEEGSRSTEQTKRDRLKKFAKSLFQAVKDLGNPEDKRGRDNEKRRANLRSSVSAPLGNRALRR